MVPALVLFSFKLIGMVHSNLNCQKPLAIMTVHHACHPNSMNSMDVDHFDESKDWFNYMRDHLDDKEMLHRCNWASFCASKVQNHGSKCSSAMLPLLQVEVVTYGMVRHTMDIIDKVHKKLKLDQPLITSGFVLVYRHGTRNSSSFFDKKSTNLNFLIILNCLEKIAPWMFTMDHSSYARWLPIFIHDLKSLQSNDPGIYKEFWQRKFTINKSRKPFSSIGINQAHKQNNKLVKIDGGATDLQHDNAALIKWTVARRKIAK